MRWVLILSLSLFAVVFADLVEPLTELTFPEFHQFTARLSAKPGENKFTLSQPEGERTFYAWVPEGYFKDQKQYGLLFAFHGLGGNCQTFGMSRNFHGYAERQGFIYVYPCGHPGVLGTGWNAGTCCLRGSNVDDNDFAKKMITTLQANFRINNTRIFSSGFSNGGMISETLACQNPGLFRAIASVGGANVMLPGNAEGLMNCDKAYASANGASRADKTTSTLIIHGDNDPTVKFEGDALLGFPPTMDDFAAWSARNKCDGKTKSTLSKPDFKNLVYDNCAYKSQVEVVRHYGGRHIWPQERDFNATTYIVDFFKRFGL